MRTLEQYPPLPWEDMLPLEFREQQLEIPWEIPEKYVEVPWENARQYVDLVQYDRNRVFNFLRGVEDFSQKLMGKELHVIDPDEHADDRNAGKILREVFGDGGVGECLMVEDIRDGQTQSYKTPSYKIDHHYSNRPRCKFELNSVDYGIPASSSIISMLVCEKLIENNAWEKEKVRAKWPWLATLALEGSIGDKVDYCCGMAALISAQVIDSGIGKLVDWPIGGWGFPVCYGIYNLIDMVAEKKKDEIKQSVENRFGNLIKKPAKQIDANTREKILEYLKKEIEPVCRSWPAEAAYLEKKGLLINNSMVGESLICPPRVPPIGTVNYMGEIFNNCEGDIALTRPKCTIRQRERFNCIDFSGRVAFDNPTLGFKRFSALINYKLIPTWYLPLIIVQPVNSENGIKCGIYCTTHSLYSGLEDFHLGKIACSVAEKVGGYGGGLKNVGGLTIPLGKDGHALSLLGEKFKKKIPEKLTYGEFPATMLDNARKSIYNQKFYNSYA